MIGSIRILLFIDSLGAGGAQRQFVGLAQMFARNGCSVKVVYYHDIPFYKPMLDEDFIEQQLINAKGYWGRIMETRRAMLGFSPDWVISFLDSPCIISCIVKLLGGRFRLLVSERNTTQFLTRKEKIKFFLYRYATKIVTNSFSQCAFIKKHYPRYQNKVSVVPNFVDTKQFRCAEERTLPQEVPEVLIVATVWESKNTLGFIEAVRLLKERGVKCHFSWFGLSEKYKDYSDKCHVKIQEYGLENMIQLLPKTQRIAEEYRQADYFCLPSFYEGTPNVICEALACGLPIACSDVCDNHLYVQTGMNGVLFDPRDAESMANALQGMLSLCDMDYRKFSHNSRSIAENKLSATHFFDGYREIVYGK